MYCSKCGKMIKPGQRFCSGCGSPVLKININRKTAGNNGPVVQAPVRSDAGDSFHRAHSLPENESGFVAEKKAAASIQRPAPDYSAHGSERKQTYDKAAANEEVFPGDAESENTGKVVYEAEKDTGSLHSLTGSEKQIIIGALLVFLLIFTLLLIPRNPEQLIIGDWDSVDSEYPDMNFQKNGNCYIESENAPFRWELVDEDLILTSDYGFGYSDTAEIEKITSYSLILDVYGTEIEYRKR